MGLSMNFANNDIYFMQVVSDKIVINDNYEGILILDSGLNTIKSIKLLDDLVIDISFIKGTEIVLHCYENQCLIHINIDSYAYKIISLDKGLKDINFLSLYEWVDNDLVLLADDGNILTYVNLLDNTVQVIQKDTIDRLQFSIHDDWNKLGKFLVHKVYPDKHSAVVESNNKLMIIDYKNSTETVLKIEPINFHDIEVTTDCVVQISEEEVLVLYGGKKVMFYPNPEDFRFLRGKFITIEKTDHLLLLMCSNSDSSKAKIEKYILASIAQ